MCHDIVIKSAFNDDYNMLHKSNLVTYQVLRQIRSYTRNELYTRNVPPILKFFCRHHMIIF